LIFLIPLITGSLMTSHRNTIPGIALSITAAIAAITSVLTVAIPDSWGLPTTTVMLGDQICGKHG